MWTRWSEMTRLRGSQGIMGPVGVEIEMRNEM